MSLPVIPPTHPLGGTGGDVVLSWQATCWLGADGDGGDVVHTLVAPDVLAVQHTNPIVTVPAGANRCRRIKLLL